ncbi:LacI family DNA-binding transcriptional regulator [Opitutus sp. ER46]|uniref:LacI family DNA-binding transcriptional regulator n=1 Tax=Opitutus sp. ER46 TaxID=2161864 RepID=UPI001304E6DC|nr:LacI family DNA-binding transcriptional regulator [Opitutus sp. ER46]
MAASSLKRIAAATGVSESTVSRILSGQAARYRISPKTAARVLACAKDEDFVPNSLARNLRLKRTHTLGLVVPDLTNPFFAGVTRQIAGAARREGFSLVLCDSEENTALEIDALRRLRGRNVEGIVICPVGLYADHLREFASSHVPVVQVDRYFADLPWPYVGCENQAGARIATSHLLSGGRSRIACIQGLPGTSTNDLRVAGYRNAILSTGPGVAAPLIVGDAFTEQSGYEHARRLLELSPRPDAILALGNVIALGAMRAIAEAGLSVPRDLALACFDEQPYAEWLAAPMTTVVQPVHQLGELAARQMFTLLREPAAKPASVLLPTQLVIRASTAPTSAFPPHH